MSFFFNTKRQTSTTERRDLECMMQRRRWIYSVSMRRGGRAVKFKLFYDGLDGERVAVVSTEEFTRYVVEGKRVSEDKRRKTCGVKSIMISRVSPEVRVG